MIKYLLTFPKRIFNLKFYQWKTKEFGQTDLILLNN